MTETRKTTRQRRFARTPGPATLESTAPDFTPAAPSVADLATRPPSKIASVIALLQRQEGATLGEMIEETGWQPHTTRAALTGLRKKGHTIERTKRGDVTCYRIASEA